MDNERRLATLEQEIESLRQNFQEYAKIHQHILGESQAFQAAITALIAAHPDPDLLADQLQHHLARPEAREVFEANNEERLQGLQAAQAYLLDVCSIAQKLRRTPQ
jgi:hypothetical protein